MANVCPSCSTENPDGARFCMSCGGALTEAAPVEERRLVTILFADLVGFTQRSDNADPEDVRRTLIPFHRAAKEEIERHGGRLDKFIGDAAMGVFGAPVAHGDDPERAVRAARALLARVPDLRSSGEPAVSIRVAVNTGEAVVAFGAGPQLGEAVAGDVVNTASRMQALAPPDGLVVGEQAWRAISDRFDAEMLEPIAVKGKADPLRVWSITSERPFASTPSSPFVGRRTDLEALEAALSAAGSDPAAIVTVIGEPGSGKSRLVGEFRDRTSERGVAWWTAGFAPYGDEGPFLPLADLLDQAVGGTGSGGAPSIRSALDSVLARCATDADDEAWLRARLDPVLGLGSGLGSSAEEMPVDIGRAVGRVLAACVSGTTVISIGDVHWAEHVVRTVLRAALVPLEGAPVLLLCTARPELLESEAAGAWGAHLLSPLGIEETEDLVRSLRGDVLDERGVAAVVASAAGNPLFAMEFVRTLRDADHRAEGVLDVPTSVRGVIAGRLDALPDHLRTSLLDASVVGSTFWADALGALAADRDPSAAGSGDVGSPRTLEELADRGLVAPVETGRLAGHVAYGFSHALVREEAYGRLPRGVRAKKHLAVGRWLEEAVGDDRGAFADALARHFAEAAELARAADVDDVHRAARPLAIRWLLRAGEGTLRLDPARAFTLVSRALDLDPEGEELERALATSAIAGRRCSALSAVDVLERLQRSLELARERGDRNAEGYMLTRVGSQLGAMGDSARAVAAYDQAIGLLEGHPAGRALAAAFMYRAEEEMFAGRSASSLELVERGLPIARDGRFDDLVIMGLHMRGDARNSLGDLRGVDDLAEALDLAKRSAGASEIVTSLNYVADWRWQLEGPRVARALYEEGLRLADERGAASQGLWFRADLAFLMEELGGWDRALELTGALLVEGPDRIDAAARAAVRALRATIALRRGRRAEAEDPAEVLALAEGSHELQALVPALAYAAEAAAADGAAVPAMTSIERLLEHTAGATPAYRAAQLPRLCRAALRIGDRDLAGRLVEEPEAPLTPRDRLFMDAAVALVREADGDLEGALQAFEALRTRWATYGHIWEEAQAALGVARTAAGLGRGGEAAAAENHATASLDRLGVPTA